MAAWVTSCCLEQHFFNQTRYLFIFHVINSHFLNQEGLNFIFCFLQHNNAETSKALVENVILFLKANWCFRWSWGNVYLTSLSYWSCLRTYHRKSWSIFYLFFLFIVWNRIRADLNILCCSVVRSIHVLIILFLISLKSKINQLVVEEKNRFRHHLLQCPFLSGDCWVEWASDILGCSVPITFSICDLRVETPSIFASV